MNCVVVARLLLGVEAEIKQAAQAGVRPRKLAACPEIDLFGDHGHDVAEGGGRGEVFQQGCGIWLLAPA